jgi:hypothetical protein
MVASVAVPSRVHVTGMPPHCCRRIAAHVRQSRSARLDLGYTARPHVSVVVVRDVGVDDPSGFTRLCLAVPCGEDSVARWVLGGAVDYCYSSLVMGATGVLHTELRYRYRNPK